MTIDAVASEPQFLDHLAPVWRPLPASARGRFLVAPGLTPDFDHDVIDVDALRVTPQDPGGHTGRPALVASIGDIKIGRRLGYGPFVFLEHGAGQAYTSRLPTMASYPGGPDRADNAVFLCPNEYSAGRWRAAYPSARVEVIGCPKLDALPAREPGPGPVVAVSFHGEWPRGVPYGGNALSDWINALPLLAERFTVIGHGHPGQGWGARLARVFERHGIEFVRDFAEVCRRADVYVCDNSSTIFEFASTGRPVVLLNARHWRRGDPGPGGRFWDWSSVGPNVWPGDDLVAVVERAIEDPVIDAELREETLAAVYAYRHGAGERAAAVISDWLAGQGELAA